MYAWTKKLVPLKLSVLELLSETKHLLKSAITFLNVEFFTRKCFDSFYTGTSYLRAI